MQTSKSPVSMCVWSFISEFGELYWIREVLGVWSTLFMAFTGKKGAIFSEIFCWMMISMIGQTNKTAIANPALRIRNARKSASDR